MHRPNLSGYNRCRGVGGPSSHIRYNLRSYGHSALPCPALPCPALPVAYMWWVVRLAALPEVVGRERGWMTNGGGEEDRLAGRQPEAGQGSHPSLQDER